MPVKHCWRCGGFVNRRHSVRFRGRASSTWVAKRQRGCLLSISSQVRVLPHVRRARADRTATALLTRSTRVRILPGARPRRPVARSPPSQGGEPGSIPGGAAHESRSSSRRGCRTFIPETRVRVPHATQARGVGTQPPLRTAAFEVRLLARARHRWRQRAAASHKRGSVRAALTAGIRASSNGRAAVLQTADECSIHSARTLQSEASGEAARLSTG